MESNQNQSKQNTLLLVNETEHWPLVTERLQDIANGKATLGEIVLIIDSFAKRFVMIKGTNTFVLGLYLDTLPIDDQILHQTEIFPKIAKLILRTPELFPSKIPLFVENVPQCVKLSKEQCACLLAHMFMCITLPPDLDVNLPLNFSVIFSKHGPGMDEILIEKLKCMFNYFKRVLLEPFPESSVVFTRLVRNDEMHGNCTIEGWSDCEDVLSEVKVRETGKIEDAKGAIEADFANAYLGGGVLGTGRVQEEIMFTVSPEHMVGMLFCECMNEKEAIFIKGAETYCAYKGYADTFEFVCDYKDDQGEEKEVVAIDAIYFGNSQYHQFSKEAILRELNKAYVGFYGTQGPDERKMNKPLSTGKWGCGAFMGDVQLKFVIQWLASSRAKREMIFYSFGDKINMYLYEEVLREYKGKKVKDLVRDMLEVSRRKVEVDSAQAKGFFKTSDKRIQEKKNKTGEVDDMEKGVEAGEEGVKNKEKKYEYIRLFQGLLDLKLSSS